MLIRSQYEISVGGKQDNRSIDDIREASSAEPDAGEMAKYVAESDDLKCRQQPCNIYLPARPAPPYLSYDATMRPRSASREQFLLDQRDGVTIGALDRD